MNLKELDVEFGNRVKERRLKLGYTQEELAERLGFSTKSSISKLEKGINSAPQSVILKLANELRVSVNYLITGIEGENEFADTVEQLADELSAGEKEFVIDFIYFLISRNKKATNQK